MARRRHSKRRRRGGLSVLYKLLSITVICVAVVVALTLFFRVDTIVVTGQARYSAAQVQEATGIHLGDNLYFLNKNSVARSLQASLPYIKSVRINRKLPDTLLVEVEECGTPLAVLQDGGAWLLSPGDRQSGRIKIVDRVEESAAADFGVIDGCALLAPSVGGQMAFATEYADRQESLTALLQALEDAGMTEQVAAIHLGDPSELTMEFAGRFTVRMPYGADYALKLKILRQVLETGAIQENMTGTFDLMSDSGRALFSPNYD